jgi:hypothetical protein
VCISQPHSKLQFHSFSNTVPQTESKVVTTSHLSTKLLNADGSAGNFSTASRAVMAPQLGSLSFSLRHRSILRDRDVGSAYLPAGRSYKVVIAPDTQTSGSVASILLSSFLCAQLCCEQSSEDVVVANISTGSRNRTYGSI